MERKPSVTHVEIFGQTYSVRAVGEPEYIVELAAYVDGKMREVASHAPTVDATKIAILTALNISDEFHQYRARMEKGDPGRYAHRANRLVERMDQILKTFPRGVPAVAGNFPDTMESIGTLRGA
mgnify:CR=1 FL=1